MKLLVELTIEMFFVVLDSVDEDALSGRMTPDGILDEDFEAELGSPAQVCHDLLGRNVFVLGKAEIVNSFVRKLTHKP